MPSKATASLETRVTTFTFAASSPVTTTLADGGWLVSWNSDQQDGSGLGVYQQRFNPLGKMLEDEAKVNSFTAGDQHGQSVVGLADGGWIVTWQYANGSLGTDIYQQRYEADGDTVGLETLVDTYVTGDQQRPSVIAFEDGGWLVTWEGLGEGEGSRDIYQQHYNSFGSKMDGQQRVNANLAGLQRDASTAVLAGGGWVVAWETYGTGDNPETLSMRVYDDTGATVIEETPLFVGADPGVIAMTGLADGGFVVVYDVDGTDGDGRGILQQRFNTEGVALDPGEVVNATTAGAQSDADIVALADGGWLVVWTGTDGDGTGIFQQRYDADGEALGTETRVNDQTTGGQSNASVTAFTNGGWMVSWEDDSSSGGGAIQQRHFAVDIDGTAEKDILHGTSWGESLAGLGGKDRLEGGRGDDLLSGGNASDRFIFASGCDKDVIDDFAARGAGHDVIDLKGLKSVKNFADLRANHLERNGSDIVIDAGKGDAITLDGVRMKDINASDFLF